ncbi:MAG: FHA domain-containing protein [Anaerolineales bacterium]
MMQPGSGSSFRLIVRRGPQPNQIYELNKDVITIGRDITNDITINDPEVSRHHARLSRQNEHYIIEDVGSTNGTFVNGQRLSSTRVLSPGETLGLGETVTLAYESSSLPNMPMQQTAPAAPQQSSPSPAAQSGAAGTEVGQPESAAQVPQQYQPYAPPAQQQPPGGYGQPSPYAPPSGGSSQPVYAEQPPSPYSYRSETTGRSRFTSWFLLGCGCFIVLCVIGAVVALIIIDSTCAWQEEPIFTIIDAIGLEPDTSSAACQ